jgi:uncharacterized membrane protein
MATRAQKTRHRPYTHTRTQAHACTHARAHTEICNTYCFSTTTMVSWTRLNVTFCVHCLSCNIILPSTPRSFKWSPSRRFPHQWPVCTLNSLLSPLSHTCYMPWPSQSSWFDHRTNIWWEVQTINIYNPTQRAIKWPRNAYTSLTSVTWHQNVSMWSTCNRIHRKIKHASTHLVC